MFCPDGLRRRGGFRRSAKDRPGQGRSLCKSSAFSGPQPVLKNIKPAGGFRDQEQNHTVFTVPGGDGVVFTGIGTIQQATISSLRDTAVRYANLTGRA